MGRLPYLLVYEFLSQLQSLSQQPPVSLLLLPLFPLSFEFQYVLLNLWTPDVEMFRNPPEGAPILNPRQFQSFTNHLL